MCELWPPLIHAVGSPMSMRIPRRAIGGCGGARWAVRGPRTVVRVPEARGPLATGTYRPAQERRGHRWARLIRPWACASLLG